MKKVLEPSPLWGLLAEFDSADKLLGAVLRARKEGYGKMDAYSPYAVDGVAEALGADNSRVATFTLLGGLAGGFGGYFMQYYAMARDYPLNIGGRPLHSWPAFIPVTFELTVLGASLVGLLAMLLLNGLPMPYHPVFNVSAFAAASDNKFFLGIESGDPKFDPEVTRRFLEGLGSSEVSEIVP